jgi:hypothetical protein
LRHLAARQLLQIGVVVRNLSIEITGSTRYWFTTVTEQSIAAAASRKALVAIPRESKGLRVVTCYHLQGRLIERCVDHV